MGRQLISGLSAFLLIAGFASAQDASVDDTQHARTKQILWRGVAKDTLSDKPEKNAEKLDKAVDKMFKSHPKHKNAGLGQKKRHSRLAATVTATAPSAGQARQSDGFSLPSPVLAGGSSCSEEDYACGDCSSDDAPHPRPQVSQPNANASRGPPCQSVPRLLCEDFRPVGEALCGSQQGQPNM